MKLNIYLIALIFIINVKVSVSQVPEVITKEMQAAFTPKTALDSLEAGNNRFINSNQIHRNMIKESEYTSAKQYPYAVIVGCIDSRVPAEIIFDQGIGSIFNARVAGNVIDEDILGSLEFSCKVTGAKLIVVLGHSNCGAIKGACDNVKLGNLTALLNKIKPAVDSVKEFSDRSSSNYKFVEEVAKENVILNMNKILADSPILKEMIEKGEIGLTGGMYNLETGKVEFYAD
jgi:carbonic anhydrase